jgi:hypothetical protein
VYFASSRCSVHFASACYTCYCKPWFHLFFFKCDRVCLFHQSIRLLLLQDEKIFFFFFSFVCFFSKFFCRTPHAIEKNDTLANASTFKVSWKWRVIQSVIVVVDKKRNSQFFDKISFKQSKYIRLIYSVWWWKSLRNKTMINTIDVFQEKSIQSLHCQYQKRRFLNKSSYLIR